MSFEELGLSPAIVRALKEDQITEPTLIQTRAIPLVKAGNDVIGKSKTGSGKTLAFGAPILEMIKPRAGLQVLIVAPVRELAVQISRELRKFGKYLKFNVATVYGGVALNPQFEKISKADIVVGTPGRLLDHLNRKTMNLKMIKCVVLDEADKMVEMGFIEDVQQILDSTPKDRQILLFGATISDEIGLLQQKYMHNVAVAQAEVHVGEHYLHQFFYNVRPNEKFSLLVHLIKSERIEKAIVFCSTRATVDMVSRNLRKQGIKAMMIHGKLSQNKRERITDEFKTGKLKILVASAVAARGIDVKDVTHIINYDLSKDPEEYIHRVGRTARAGEIGKAITLLSPKDYDIFNEVLDNYPVEVKELPLPKFQRMFFDAGRREPRVERSGGFERPRHVARAYSVKSFGR
ncbi:MAG: DEAD/DEAH box helicase [Candidatus Woesearchaeota archaeon]